MARDSGGRFYLSQCPPVCQAIADYLHQEGLAPQGVVIGHDTRFPVRGLCRHRPRGDGGQRHHQPLHHPGLPHAGGEFATLAGHAPGPSTSRQPQSPEDNGIRFSLPTGAGTVNGDQRHPSPSSALSPCRCQDHALAAARDQDWSSTWNPGRHCQHLKTLVDLEVLERSGLKGGGGPALRHWPGLPGHLSQGGGSKGGSP